MQTLRVYTKRVFALLCTVFFVFLIMMSSHRIPSSPIVSPGGRGHPRVIHPIPSRHGEQLPFQPQPPPELRTHHVNYKDLKIERKFDQHVADRIRAHLKGLDLQSMSRLECIENITLADYWLQTQNRVVPIRDPWERFYAQISTCSLYQDEKIIEDLLNDLNKLPIKRAAIMEGGTQVKLILTFENNKQAVFKPMRYGRNYETDPNHFYFGDFERHNAEIATYHMDKVLGHRRAVPTVGRIVSISKELREKAERKLRKTFFVSPAKNHCFVSKCDYYCDTTHAICGSPDLKEGSVQVFLPDDTNVPRRHNKSPYRRTYSKKNQVADWQSDMSYCDSQVKMRRQYAHGRRLLDLVDLHIMDYLIINQDRHHYETFQVFGSYPSYAIHLDNGRSFGRTDIDDDDILMPLRQCCVIRPSMLSKLISFYTGRISLSEALHTSMSDDPATPVLAFKHYNAIERRLDKIMRHILECMDRHGSVENIIITEFHNNKVETPLPGEDIDATEDLADIGDNKSAQRPQLPHPPSTKIYMKPSRQRLAFSRDNTNLVKAKQAPGLSN